MRTCKILPLVAFTVLLMSTSAFAVGYGHGKGGTPDFPNTLDDFTGNRAIYHYLTLTDVPTGEWDVNFVYTEASHEDQWAAVTGETLSNLAPVGTSLSGVTLFGSTFSDVTDAEVFSTVNRWAVKVFEVYNPFTVNGFDFLAGDLLIAFNDAWKGDRDFDDMILQARTAATPIPGAIWLLGSGLVGLVGLRRKLRQ